MYAPAKRRRLILVAETNLEDVGRGDRGFCGRGVAAPDALNDWIVMPVVLTGYATTKLPELTSTASMFAATPTPEATSVALTGDAVV